MTRSTSGNTRRSALRAELDELAERMARLRARLEDGGERGPLASLAPPPDIDGIVRIARAIQERRKAGFDSRWIEGPAWSILLLLFDRRAASDREADIRKATGLARDLVHRWLGLLRTYGLVDLGLASSGEYCEIGLTECGRMQMTDVFFEASLAITEPGDLSRTRHEHGTDHGKP